MKTIVFASDCFFKEHCRLKQGAVLKSAFKSAGRAFVPAGMLFLFLIAVPDSAVAHGTEYRVLKTMETIAVECLFSDGEPMQYAEAVLYSPDNDTLEYQNGRTDNQGRFCFLPNQPGTWRLKVRDGMGHGINAEIDVGEALPKKAETDSQKVGSRSGKLFFAGDSVLSKVVLGVSLLINIFFGLSLTKRRKAK